MRPNSNIGYVSALSFPAPVKLENDPQAPAAPLSALAHKADMPRIENRHTLRDFGKALHNYYLAPQTTRVGIAYYGDSVASEVSEAFVLNLLHENLPRADLQYPEALQSSLLYEVTGTPLAYDSVVSGDPAADFTYLPSARHKTLSGGSVVTFDAQQSTGFNEARAYFATGPGFGSVSVELINRDTSAVISTQNLDLSGVSLGLAKVTFADISRSTKYRLRVTSAGTSIFLHAIFLKPAGVLPINLARGGSTYAQNNASASAIFTALCADLHVSLIFSQTKGEDAGTDIVPAMERMALVAGASKFIVGSLPDSSPEAGQIETNESIRSAALAFGYAYFDARSAFGAAGAYAELTRLGWNGDGTHAHIGAHRYVASLIHGELGHLLALGGVLRRNVDHRGRLAGVVATQTYQVFAGDGSETPVRVMTNAGGGAPAKAALRNIYRVFFDDAGATQAYLSGRDSTSFTALTTAGTPAAFYGLSVQLTQTNDFSISSAGGATFAGNVELTNAEKGLILKSPDGTRYRITVANGGALTAAAL